MKIRVYYYDGSIGTLSYDWYDHLEKWVKQSAICGWEILDEKGEPVK